MLSLRARVAEELTAATDSVTIEPADVVYRDTDEDYPGGKRR